MIEVLLTVGSLIFLIGFICLTMDASGWAFFCGTTGTSISNNLIGISKSAGGFVWKKI